MLWLFEQIEKLDDHAVLKLLPQISSERREKVLRMRDRSTQIQLITAEFLLRLALWEEYGIRRLPAVAHEKNGKPFFPDHPKICFNLSHCQTAVACAVDASPVGVDVQDVGCLYSAPSRVGSDQALPSSATRAVAQEAVQSLLWVLHSAERAWVLSGETAAERERRFLIIWTYKEAFGKATGAGILYEMDQFNFLPSFESGSCYARSFQSFSRTDTVLTLCAQAPLEFRVVSIQELFASGYTVP
ncbi:MAG: 4'-phosphopantetheinyl transferase superfamily protein [Oscillospiraceae bacterium]|nr:4'-phosphopantetheinyl transferase superfamily protein [Oscillospiraceae bacterium]